jgi:hypothetical protein
MRSEPVRKRFGIINNTHVKAVWLIYCFRGFALQGLLALLVFLLCLCHFVQFAVTTHVNRSHGATHLCGRWNSRASWGCTSRCACFLALASLSCRDQAAILSLM